MMTSGVGLAELCPTSVGPKTRDRLRTSILQSGLCDTLQHEGLSSSSPPSPFWGTELEQGSENEDVGAGPQEPMLGRDPYLSRCSMRKARVSLLAGGSLLTTWRRAVPQAASSAMSAAAPGMGVREAAPSHPPPETPTHQQLLGRQDGG